ncbi:hypothetical protein T265_06712 [Opisthorchis viverrini]|uniref:Uncharacterized protein n=1 Tax=Opisthorchis viverrini TaxID=6198 RepID=A0A074ZF98_OPIVI|nr:hypothetical protein T265_06712 [Opisthorchis viverrini]KER25961.1 hypothetical protein T265_06712 [Opisthorchis viverrini]
MGVVAKTMQYLYTVEASTERANMGEFHLMDMDGDVIDRSGRQKWNPELFTERRSTNSRFEQVNARYGQASCRPMWYRIIIPVVELRDESICAVCWSLSGVRFWL